MEQEKNSAAKFSFYYIFSLIALIFMALSAGIIIFQIINKNIVDALETFRGQYSSGALKFAISAIIIASPIYYLITAQINKNLFFGKLDKDSGARKWLSYLILLVSSLVMLGFLIGTVFNFLEGELTIKFILKVISAIAISAIIFTYYLYDIRRENVVGDKNKIIKIYAFGSMALVAIILISAFVFVESPAETRGIKYDTTIINRFNQIDNGINQYFTNNKKLPENLDLLLGEVTFLREGDMTDPTSKKRFNYRIADEKTYELCAVFMVNSSDYENRSDYYLDKRWGHTVGYQCLKQKIIRPEEGAMKDF